MDHKFIAVEDLSYFQQGIETEMLFLIPRSDLSTPVKVLGHPNLIQEQAEKDLRQIAEAGLFDFYGRKKCENLETTEDALRNMRSCVIEVLAADVRSSYQTKKARKGKSQAGLTLKVKKNLNDNKTKISTQQLDNLLIHFSVEVVEVEYLDDDPGRNSGCNDRVIIHKFEVIGT